jgi:L-lactate dehydrogenase complex protein LldF
LKLRVEESARQSPACVPVAEAARTVSERRRLLAASFGDWDGARKHAAAVKDAALADLRGCLERFERQAQANGVQARDAQEANRAVEEICRRASPEGALVVKGKSMATEETHLNSHLVSRGHQVVETDLGEYVVQLDGDTPSHIVAPIIHKSRQDVARTFAAAGLGPYTEDPVALAGQARARLRCEFKRADVGISGVNFALAESGRIVIVENEGNNRLSTTAPRVHVAVMGIEKILPRDADLALYLRLLVGSATGQTLTTTIHVVDGPRRVGELDGPEEVHVVLLDNGRSRVANGPHRSILRCLRCGACLNVCPVYRAVGGHAYGHVYPGPVGAVLAPALEGVEAQGDLAKASTLCGACQEVCPVDIPIPEMLLRLREERARGRPSPQSRGLAALAERDGLWRASLRLLPMAGRLAADWTATRDWPERRGDFRRWWRGRT